MSEFGVQVPPDSTGKIIRHEVQIEIDYAGATREPEFAVGEYVKIPDAKVEGIVLLFHTGVQHVEPHIHIKLAHGSATSLSAGQDIQVDGVTVAVTGAATVPFYIPTVIQAGANNPTYGQSIDKVGASSVRFAEGSPQFDANGRMEVSQARIVAEYVHSYDELPEKFGDVTSGVNTLTYVNNTRGVTLGVGSDAGDRYLRTSHEYHPYQAGVSQGLAVTVALSDGGKVGNTRRWGMFDAKNGIGIGVVDTEVVCFIRSYASGVAVDTVVAQVDWNGDKLNGEGGAFNISEVNLDVATNNLFWFDYLWQGAGSVRIGVEINGVRETMHTFHNANKLLHSYMSTGSLPFSVENVNTGATSGTSELKTFCATVTRSGEHNAVSAPHGDAFSAAVTTTSATPIVTIRPKQTFRTFDNRQVIQLTGFSAFNAGADAIILKVSENGSITGGVWSDHNILRSSSEVLTGGSAIVDDHGSRYFLIAGGETISEKFGECLTARRLADITLANTLNISGKLAVAGTGGALVVTLNWDEISD